MILIPIAIFCLIHVGIHGWRRRWKNATIYLFAAVISLLWYALHAEASMNRHHIEKIDELNGQVRELNIELMKIEIEQ